MKQLNQLLYEIKKAESIHEKLEILNQNSCVKSFFSEPSFLKTFLMGLSPECSYVLKAIVAMGQRDLLFPTSKEFDAESMRHLLEKMLQIENFYKEIGGIIGYQLKIMKLLEIAKKKEKLPSMQFFAPPYVDMSEVNAEVQKMIYWGIKYLPEVSELYPIGGAADRLHLQDESTGKELPAAKLEIGGKPLLCILIEDVQAREYLFYKLFEKQITTPIAMMTSNEKNNHQHIEAICEEREWFHRPKDSIRLFKQPSVPTVTIDGDWFMKAPLNPLLKPGGHGAIWKLAKDHQIFDWLKKKKRTKAILRQINNPIAGLDYHLLSFAGWGSKNNKIFGFTSCPRLFQAAEGVLVLLEKKMPSGFDYVITNIEYCDFAKYRIEDVPLKKGEKYSKFPSNTNILFADLNAIEKAVEKHPFPGILVNLKDIQYFKDGKVKKKKIARLESTMQNIADVLVEHHANKIKEGNISLDKTFVAFHKREKILSPAKKVYAPDKSLLETPEKCFYDLLMNHSNLLKQCEFIIPDMPSIEEYVKTGPSFLFSYHSALGPLYQIIKQKLKKGVLTARSELILEIAELDIENLELDGSMHIQALTPLGAINAKNTLIYSEESGKCVLKNVKIKNRGIDWKNDNVYWKHRFERNESFKVTLEKNAEFYAEDVTFLGNCHYRVPANKRLFIYEKNGSNIEIWENIESPSWYWKYRFNQSFFIILEKRLFRN